MQIKAIFYEGDTERLFIRKAMTLEKYKKLSQQYVAFIQVGGAYAKNYEKLIRLLGIKSLIITDVDYEKEKLTVADIEDAITTNATIKHFYSSNHPDDNPSVRNLYAWKDADENIMDNLIIYVFRQVMMDMPGHWKRLCLINIFPWMLQLHIKKVSGSRKGLIRNWIFQFRIKE